MMQQKNGGPFPNRRLTDNINLSYCFIIFKTTVF